MHDVQKLSLLLDELGSRYGIANLKLPAHGAVGLRLKDGAELYLEHAAEQRSLYAYMPLMALPQQEVARLALLSRLLEFNYLGGESVDAVLSIHKGMAIVHSVFIVATLQFDAFDRALQQLIATRTSIAEKLKSAPASDSSVPSRTRHSSSTLLAAFKQGATHGQAS